MILVLMRLTAPSLNWTKTMTDNRELITGESITPQDNGWSQYSFYFKGDLKKILLEQSGGSGRIAELEKQIRSLRVVGPTYD